jgi:tetratricopeptide (TPR) repeat protein
MAKILNSNSNDLDPALDLFDEALEIDPENVKALVDKGNALFYTEWPQRSDKLLDSVHFYCDKAIELAPEYANSYFIKALCYNTNVSGKDSAIEYFLKTIELAPSHAQAYVNLGDIFYRHKKEYTKGLYYLSRSMELNINNETSVYNGIGDCLLNAGLYDKAKEYYMKTIISDVPFDVRGGAFNSYSGILMVEEKHQEAYSFMDTMYSYMPGYAGWIDIWQLTHSIFNRDFERAEIYIDKLTMRWIPTFMQTGVAWMYQQTGREPEAAEIIENGIRYYKGAVEKNANWHNFLFLSNFYTLKGEKKEALRYFAKWIDTGVLGGWQDIFESNPMFENLWDEPEFKLLVQRVKKEKEMQRKQILEMIEKEEINL